MKTGYLKKDRQERYNLHRSWVVNAWRILTEDGVDMVLPWMNTKGEARKVAKELGVTLVEQKRKG